MIDKAVDVAADLCRHFEGLHRLKGGLIHPYICPAGYPTQGYGTVYRPDGKAVTMQDDPITRSIANEWLLSELERVYLRGVLIASPQLAARPKALGAIASFAYNLGVARYRSSTLRRRIDQGDWGEARIEIMRWTRAGGKVLPGLVRRRQAERDLLPT
jgi:lysozyme